jgi:rubrerythrin
MQRELFRQLWVMRFEKMLRLEEEALEAYEAVLDECHKNYGDEKEVQAHLKSLITDEKKHARLVQELIKIVKRQEHE